MNPNDETQAPILLERETRAVKVREDDSMVALDGSTLPAGTYLLTSERRLTPLKLNAINEAKH